MTALRAKQGFTAFIDGTGVPVKEGTILDSTHPVVKGREELFAAVDESIEPLGRPKRFGEAAPRSEVLMERATAEPGERRTVNPKPDPQEKPEAPKAVSRPTPRAGTKGKQDGEV